MINQIAVRKVLVCSTGHVSPETRAWLDGESAKVVALQSDPKAEYPNLHLFPNVNGWMFWADEDPDGNGWPAEIVALMKRAREEGADWVDLDSAGDKLDDLPFWEW
jgi:hypothetical protein